jgi:hypothetical protein
MLSNMTTRQPLLPKEQPLKYEQYSKSCATSRQFPQCLDAFHTTIDMRGQHWQQSDLTATLFTTTDVKTRMHAQFAPEWQMPRHDEISRTISIAL